MGRLTVFKEYGVTILEGFIVLQVIVVFTYFTAGEVSLINNKLTDTRQHHICLW